MMASPFIFQTPSTFLEWDGNSLTTVPPAPNAENDSSYYGNMLVLPTGQILFTDFFFVSVYNPTGTYNPAWAPRIQSAPARVSPGGIVCYLRSPFQRHVARGCLRRRSAIGNELSARPHHQQRNWTRVL